jgi:hypothetical protein
MLFFDPLITFLITDEIKLQIEKQWLINWEVARTRADFAVEKCIIPYCSSEIWLKNAA